MKKFTGFNSFLIVIILILLGIISFLYLPKINYLEHIAFTQKEKNQRKFRQTSLLKKHVRFFVKNNGFSEMLHLVDYKDYITINNDYCEIEDDFFTQISSNLEKESIIFKPKLQKKGENDTFVSSTLGKKIFYTEVKKGLCNFIFSDSKIGNIELELKKYNYSKNTFSDINTYTVVGEYSIHRYRKTPDESLINSQTLINKISYELIYPGEHISILEKLGNKGGKDLLESNILKDGAIVKGIGGGSCLASTIIYRTLLDAGVDVISQKAHNIYYKNIYSQKEIGLDSTIYEDETYKVDLLFTNNYNSPIIFVPVYSGDVLVLKIYAKNIEYKTSLESIDIENKNNIRWNYVRVSLADNTKDTTEIHAKYDEIDDY